MKTLGLTMTSDRRTWTDAQLTIAVQTSTTWSDVVRKLHLRRCSGNFATAKKHVKRLTISTSHFCIKKRSQTSNPRYTLKEILVQNSTYRNNGMLKARLIREGLLTYICIECGASDWRDKPLSLHLDHINGVSDDHRFENLRLLCPNCHSQTNTYAGRNISPQFRRHKTNMCLGCGTRVSRNALRCYKCLSALRLEETPTKIEWPPIDQLTEEISRTSFLATGKRLGVSDNAVRQHLRRRGVDLQPFRPRSKREH